MKTNKRTIQPVCRLVTLVTPDLLSKIDGAVEAERARGELGTTRSDIVRRAIARSFENAESLGVRAVG